MRLWSLHSFPRDKNRPGNFFWLRNIFFQVSGHSLEDLLFRTKKKRCFIITFFWPSELIKFCLIRSLLKNLLAGKADSSGAYQVTFLPGIVLMPE
jgi:hypothetical protein